MDKNKKHVFFVTEKKKVQAQNLVFTTYILFFLINFIEVWQKIKIYKHKKLKL